jgi:hypothetical protein
MCFSISEKKFMWMIHTKVKQVARAGEEREMRRGTQGAWTLLLTIYFLILVVVTCCGHESLGVTP